jgi:hypothetical protein
MLQEAAGIAIALVVFVLAVMAVKSAQYLSGTGGGLIPSVELMVVLRNGKLKPIDGRVLRDSRGGYYDMETRKQVYPQELR